MSLATHRHAALVRDDRGGLVLRRFATAGDAAAVAAERRSGPADYLAAGRPSPGEEELAALLRRSPGRTMRSGDFARALGVTTHCIRALYRRGALPGAVEHGPHSLRVPACYLRLAEIYGLRGLERLARQGRLG